MSDFPGYARAQREYEDREPPVGPSECPECGGRGVYRAVVLETCDACCGSGFLDHNGKPFDPNKAERDACDRADMQRDERLTNPPDAGADDEY